MISQSDLAKALYDQAKSICDLNGYTLIPNGKPYSPTPNDAYIEEFVIYGDEEARGIEDSSSDLQLSIYQLSIHTPKGQAGKMWLARSMADTLRAGFARGTELTHNNQMARTKSSSLIELGGSETHDMHAVSINVSVIN